MSARFVAPVLLSVIVGCSSSSRDEKAQKDDGGADSGIPQPDAAVCPDDQQLDACGDCGGDGTRCMNPLEGKYAARTQFYARQQTSVGDSVLDLVSKGVLLSLVEIDKFGVASERYCFLEIASSEGVVSWTAPGTLQRVDASEVQLVAEDDRLVRPVAKHRAYFGFQAEPPADCTPGALHVSGCVCPDDVALPLDKDDCRVVDLDEDGQPGGKMYLSLGELPSVDSTDAPVKLDAVALLAIGWRLPAEAGDTLLGSIEGGISQGELGRSGELATALGPIQNAMCSDEEGHTLGNVQLVKSDVTCAELLAGRDQDTASYGLFDPAQDGEVPTVEACPLP